MNHAPSSMPGGRARVPLAAALALAAIGFVLGWLAPGPQGATDGMPAEPATPPEAAMPAGTDGIREMEASVYLSGLGVVYRRRGHYIVKEDNP